MMMTSISSLITAARDWVREVGGTTVLSTFLSLTPAPASRPKVTRTGQVYYGVNYQRFRQAAQAELEAYEGTPTDSPVLLVMEVVAARPKTGKRVTPRGDVDNFAKGPLDAMTQCGRIWDDDDQVVGMCVFKRYADPGEQEGVRLDWIPITV